MQISIDLGRSEAAALLRVLRRILLDAVESALQDQPETAGDFDQGRLRATRRPARSDRLRRVIQLTDDPARQKSRVRHASA